MAIAIMQKIRLIGHKKRQKKILDFLQKAGVVQITNIDSEKLGENWGKSNIVNHDAEFDLANIDFAINFLTPYAAKPKITEKQPEYKESTVKEIVQTSDFQKIAEKCLEIEEQENEIRNNLNALETDNRELFPWKSLELKLDAKRTTSSSHLILAAIPSLEYEKFKESLIKKSDLFLIEKIGGHGQVVYFQIICALEILEDTRKLLAEHKGQEADLPQIQMTVSEKLSENAKESKELAKKIAELEKEKQKLSKHMAELKVAHDYIVWAEDAKNAHNNIFESTSSFIAEGWIPQNAYNKFSEKLEEVSKEIFLEKIEPGQDEKPPVEIKNSEFLKPFETVTLIFGLPLPEEVDPTPFHALFFIIFFGLCLTDAAYGIIMFIVTALALKFLPLEGGIRKLVKLLMYGGIATFVIGGLFGGWFGFTPDQAPNFLLTTNAAGEQIFIFQKVNSITDPLTVLILALGLGYIQLLFGVTIKFIHRFKTSNKLNAVLDHGLWVYTLSATGLYILNSAKVLSIDPKIVQWIVLAGIIALILTQGRDKKNIIAKFFSGILSLYNFVGYTGDILSYSRLLALGLATSIIAMAVNTVVELVGGLPYIGWLLMAIVFVGGHIFNLVLNALGSFIHSGRLQFVEFFGKFLEGGGVEFKPFQKRTKYIKIAHEPK